MTTLIIFRERLRKLYSENGRLVNYIAKCVLMLLTLVTLSLTLNYKGILSSFPILLVLSLVVSLLPHSAVLTTVLLVMAAEFYSFGLEPLIIYAILLVLFITVFFIFKPEKSYLMTIGILLGMLQFYGVVPVLVGLMFTPMACIYMCFGLFSSALVNYISINQAMFSQESTMSMTKKLLQIALDVFADDTLWINIFLVIMISIVVFCIRKMSVKHSWTIAVAVGCICTLLLNIVCGLILDNTNYIVLIINVFLELITGLALIFMFHLVDYSREEVLQFEDDEYIYYVKAVPKMTVAMPDMKVTRIRSHNIKNVEKTSDQVVFVKDKDDLEEKWEQVPPPAEEAEEVTSDTLTTIKEPEET